MQTTYQDKAVLVTGAGAGIGFAVCQAFAEAGAAVALIDLDEALANQAAANINEAVGGKRVAAYAVDVADVPAMNQTIAHFAEAQGRLDIVIANAGITNYGPFLEYTVEAFDRITSVNLRGSYFTAQAAARTMIDLGTSNGRILLTSSVTGVRAFLNLSAYGMTKAAIRHMAKALALELGSHGITVNAICPGAILTERTLADDPNFEANWASVTPNQRSGYVADIVAAAMFLTSPEASHVTGQTLQIDGGWTLASPLPEAHPRQPEESSKLR